MILKEEINVAIHALASNHIEDSTPIQDKLRLYLGQFGQREVPVTIDDISSALSLKYPQVYQGIKRLQEMGEIQLEKEGLPNKAERIVGIRLIKLEPSSRTYRRAADKAKRLITLPKIPTAESDPTFPRIMEYLNKKLTVEELREHAASGGLDPEVIQFEVNEVAEEAIALLQIVTNLREQVNLLSNEKQMLTFDLQAEKMNVESYKNRLRDETHQDLLAMSR